MSDIKDVKHFKERLDRLNAQIITIEKKISQQSDRFVSAAHSEEIEKLMTHQDQLTRIEDRMNKRKKKYNNKQTSPLYKYFLKKA